MLNLLFYLKSFFSILVFWTEGEVFVGIGIWEKGRGGILGREIVMGIFCEGFLGVRGFLGFYL